MSMLGEADAMTEAAYEAKDGPGPSVAPHRPDEACAVMNPANQTWSIWCPGKPGWATLDFEDGAQAIAEVMGAHSANTYCLWRVIKNTTLKGVSLGITRMACGRRNQPISSRLAVFLRRYGAIKVPLAVSARLIAPPGTKPAAEAKITLRATPQEMSSLPNSPTAPILPDAATIDGSDAPPVYGEQPFLAGVGTPGGNPMVPLLALAGVGYYIYKSLKKDSGD